MEDHLTAVRASFLSALLLGDKQKASLSIKGLIASEVPFVLVYETVIRPTLYDIGYFWEKNLISVATEHLASAIIEGIMNEIYPHITTARQKPLKVVLSCVENEKHKLGLKMVGDVFEHNGWETFFLGQDTPSDALAIFVDEINPDVCCLSLTIYFNHLALHKLISDLKAKKPDLTLLLGGQGLSPNMFHFYQKAYSKTHSFPNLFELNQFLDFWPNEKE